MELRPGYMVGPSVRLERPLGAGRRGVCWAARELSLGTEVDVEILPPEVAERSTEVEPFLREAKRAAKIESRHVVRIFDIGRTPDGLPFVVTERRRGETLEARVHRRGPFELEQVVTIVEQAADALSAAHRRDLLHRAIAPSKVLLASRGGELDVKLVDFDLTDGGDPSLVPRRGMTTQVAASMSPEQLLAPDEVDGRMDVWSLAVTAYFALTGEMPFPGESYPALFMAIDQGDVRPPSHIRPDLPSAIDAVFARAFRRHASERHATAQELATALGDAARGTGAFTAPRPHGRDGARLPSSDAPIAMDSGAATGIATDEPTVPRRWPRWAVPFAAACAAVFVVATLRGGERPATDDAGPAMSGAAALPIADEETMLTTPVELILDDGPPSPRAAAAPSASVPSAPAADAPSRRERAAP